ncbi:unnamed protein product [Bursaphelenchus xylophilus]|uniref:(pine wood nematode) hypothetical protein n=1 Tax=Bursaphelenchus xylophilus TaxID=6326 RepID=A0A1I7S0G0_BURXY|nr:unnamed protein product [Bursaphelenchus xylophilus]CAG9132241.1 unnamed protein product [Bursaphelenchus xylophilus]
MSLWVDKYRPTSFDGLDFNLESSDVLKRLTSNNDFPHLLFHGPDGAGKETRVRCALRHIYGDGALQLKATQLSYDTPSKKGLTISALDSKFHIEIRPSDVGIHDRIVVQNVIKDTAKQFLSVSDKPFKVVVVHEADRLSFDAQSALRRTMEKHSSRCKIFLVCMHIHKMIEPLVSRCVPIRLSSPSKEELTQLVKNVAQKECFTVTDNFIHSLIETTNYNVRTTLLALEATVDKGGKNYLYDNCRIVLPDWRAAIIDIANRLLDKRRVEDVQAVRSRFYDLINALIPLDIIFEQLSIEMSKKLVSVEEKLILYDSAAKFQHMSISGDKPLLYLEAFVLDVLSKLSKTSN